MELSALRRLYLLHLLALKLTISKNHNSISTQLYGLFLRSALLVFIFFQFAVSFAQKDTSKSIKEQIDDKDIVDVYYEIFKPKKTLKPDTAGYERGKIYTSVLPGFGYSILTGFTAVITSNFSFYVSKQKKNANISSIFLSPEYGVNKQLTITYQADIFTNANKWNLVSDWRYYHYSAYIYPLGLSTYKPTKELVYYSLAKFHQLFYRQVEPDFFIGAGYKLDYHWNIKTSYNSNNPTLDEYRKYGDLRSTTSSGFVASILYDKRRNSNNPIGGGVYANVEYRDNLKLIGSNFNWRSIFYDFRKYYPLPGRSKNILAFWHFATITLHGKVPYFDLPSTMWDVYDNAGRPYIQGRFRSRNMLYFETEYRFNLTKNGLLGSSVFGNVQMFSKWPQNSFHKPIPGTGVSLRIKANKKASVNFIISYGIGIQGSRGFFFNVGDVF